MHVTKLLIYSLKLKTKTINISLVIAKYYYLTCTLWANYGVNLPKVCRNNQNKLDLSVKNFSTQ